MRASPFTPAFSQNRTWTSRLLPSVVRKVHTALLVQSQRYKYHGCTNSHCWLLAVILFQNNQSSLAVVSNSKTKQANHLRSISITETSSLLRVSPPPESHSIQTVCAFYATIPISRVHYRSLNKSPAVFIPDATLPVIKSPVVFYFLTSNVLSQFWHRLH